VLEGKGAVKGTLRRRGRRRRKGKLRVAQWMLAYGRGGI